MDDAWKLWDNIPPAFQQQASFFTDFWKAYNILDEENTSLRARIKASVARLCEPLRTFQWNPTPAL